MAHDTTQADRFIAEAREHLGSMAEAMINLERDQGNARAIVEQLLRAVHSIKGGAAFIGRRNIERLAHATEAVIENVRDGQVPRTPEVVDTLLAVLDHITALVDDLEHSDAADISEPLARLQPLLGSGDELLVPVAPVGSAAGEFALSNQTLASWPPERPYLYGIKFDWYECEQNDGLPPSQVAQRVQAVATVLESRPGAAGPPLAQGLPQPPLACLAVIASSLAPPQFSEQLRIPSATVVPLRQKEAAKPATTVAAPEARAASPTAATSLRISVPLIDRMMALAGELVLVRNQALGSSDPTNASLRQLLRRLDAVTNELQDAALRLRTQPVGALFDRFPRVVRDLARQLGKEIDVRITGSEVELDKTIIELLADPLTHLIRNCCDHGIELPQSRAAEGKPPAGTIDLSARQERGQIVIEIRDDGRGIDLAALKRKAIEQGLKRRDELDRMSERQVYDLILMSGISTASRVTDLSGRGVGMDVVKTNIDQIGGVLEIETSQGKGTFFTLRLPLTLAIVPCLLLDSDGQSYALAQRDVEQIALLGTVGSPRGIERNHEGEVLRWRGRLLPVLRLREVLGRREPLDTAAVAEIAGRYRREQTSCTDRYAAIVRSGSRLFSLVFDDVVGSENIVVKPLHALLRPLGIYAATTILGDGKVALILNIEGIARHSGIFQRAAHEQAPSLPGPALAAPLVPILLFRCGGGELLAIPMEVVRRVVTVKSRRIGQRELVDVDGKATNVLRLEHFLNLPPCEDADGLLLVLPRRDAPVGLLVREIVDTPSLHIQLDQQAYAADGILGTMMVRGEIALFVDLDRIITMWEQAHHVEPAQNSSSGGRILVVDDTQFFQKLVSEYLRSKKHDVSVAPNGSEGLAMLKAGEFDLVVCDIEMPVMDGLTFARRVRQDPKLAGIPLLALTTLNTPQSRDAAAASGFDEYQVKLDRRNLLAAVDQLLARGRLPALPGALKHE